MSARFIIPLATVLFAAALVAAQENAAPPVEQHVARAALAPGQQHQVLAKLVGDWTTTSKLTMAGMPPDESEGSATLSMELEGRFLREEYVGSMMGMPFTSVKLLGFNNGSQKYEGVWMYTLGTNMMTLSGSSADGGQTITCEASWDNEIGVSESVTITYHLVDDNHFKMTMVRGEMPDGSAGPEMEIAYLRKK